MESSTWFDHLRTEYDPQQGVDLYVHIPFCENLCSYCGCHRQITKNHAVEGPYLEALLKEWQIYQDQLGPLRVRSLHLGGGTPTFLSPRNLHHLCRQLLGHHPLAPDFHGQVEMDPRTATREHFQVLADLGLHHLSFGIQDFDPDVQRSIRRWQPYELVEEKIAWAREFGFRAINLDLIYGLPFQTLRTISETMIKVKALAPDTLAFYSYAHVPWKHRHQMALERFELPQGLEKRALYEHGRQLLQEQDYVEIGMDHFARRGCPLHQAFLQKKLQRNFMGYTLSKSNVLIGLGASAISSSGQSYRQNEKGVPIYSDQIMQGQLGPSHGHKLSLADMKIGKVIQDILCQREADIGEALLYLPRTSLEVARRSLQNFIDDGIIELSQGHLRVTPQGAPFLRNICMSIDPHLLQLEMDKDKASPPPGEPRDLLAPPFQFSKTV